MVLPSRLHWIRNRPWRDRIRRRQLNRECGRAQGLVPLSSLLCCLQSLPFSSTWVSFMPTASLLSSSLMIPTPPPYLPSTALFPCLCVPISPHLELQNMLCQEARERLLPAFSVSKWEWSWSCWPWGWEEGGVWMEQVSAMNGEWVYLIDLQVTFP